MLENTEGKKLVVLRDGDRRRGNIRVVSVKIASEDRRCNITIVIKETS